MLNFEVPDMFVKEFQNEFGGRQETLFNALETAEKEYGKNMIAKNRKPKRGLSPKESRSLMKTFRGKESIFKTPEVPPLRMKLKSIIQTNKSVTHSKRWIKYSLADVDEMSESSNARAAFSFLQEIEERKRGPNYEAEKCLDGFKPVFKKPCSDTRVGKAVLQPKKTRETEKKSQSSMPTASGLESPRIKLNHLSFDEEDE